MIASLSNWFFNIIVKSPKSVCKIHTLGLTSNINIIISQDDSQHLCQRIWQPAYLSLINSITISLRSRYNWNIHHIIFFPLWEIWLLNISYLIPSISYVISLNNTTELPLTNTPIVIFVHVLNMLWCSRVGSSMLQISFT